MPRRVLIVEDSKTVSDALVAAFQTRPEFRVVGAVASGDAAVRLARRMRPDLMTVDLILPDLDGVAVIRRVLKEIRTRVIVVSNRTPTKESPLSLDALRAGAMEIMPKPNVVNPASLAHLLAVASALCDHPAPGAQHIVSASDPPPPKPARVEQKRVITDKHDLEQLMKNVQPTPSRPRPQKARIVAIGASTGGPPALELLLKRLPRDFKLPIVIAQHMMAGYSEGLAAWLASAAKMPVKTAEHGELLHAGHAYLAPDGHHLMVAFNGTALLEPCSDENIHVPSVDRLFESVAKHYGSAAIAALLTGMGDDGAESLRHLRAEGAVTIAQDQASAFVFGMPHAAIQLDPGHLVLSLDHLAHYLSQQG